MNNQQTYLYTNFSYENWICPATYLSKSENMEYLVELSYKMAIVILIHMNKAPLKSLKVSSISIILLLTTYFYINFSDKTLIFLVMFPPNALLILGTLLNSPRKWNLYQLEKVHKSPLKSVFISFSQITTKCN